MFFVLVYVFAPEMVFIFFAFFRRKSSVSCLKNEARRFSFYLKFRSSL